MQVNLRWIQLKQANISTEYWPLSNKSFFCVNTIIHVLYSMAACLQLPFRSRSFQPCTKSNCKYLVSVSFSSYNWLIIWNTSEKITPHFTATFCIFLFLYTVDVHSWAPAIPVRWFVTPHTSFQGTNAPLTSFLTLGRLACLPLVVNWCNYIFAKMYLILT